MLLFNVLPIFPKHNATNCFRSYAKFFRKFVEKFFSPVPSFRKELSSFSYIFNIPICKLSLKISFSSSLPFFFYHVRRIFRRSSNVKMIRSYAWRIVTFMENKHSLRNWAIKYFPNYAVGPTRFSSNFYNCITPVVTSVPYPTGLSFFNSAKKPFFDFMYANIGTGGAFFGKIKTHVEPLIRCDVPQVA